MTVSLIIQSQILGALSFINEGLDFILTHFEVPRWPRRISSKLTEGRQILAHNKEEALARFRQDNSDWLDKCNKVERLNFNAKAKISEGFKGAAKGYYPISLKKLKEENKVVYDRVMNY